MRGKPPNVYGHPGARCVTWWWSAGRSSRLVGRPAGGSLMGPGTNVLTAPVGAERVSLAREAGWIRCPGVRGRGRVGLIQVFQVEIGDQVGDQAPADLPLGRRQPPVEGACDDAAHRVVLARRHLVECAPGLRSIATEPAGKGGHRRCRSPDLVWGSAGHVIPQRLVRMGVLQGHLLPQRVAGPGGLHRHEQVSRVMVGEPCAVIEKLVETAQCPFPLSRERVGSGVHRLELGRDGLATPTRVAAMVSRLAAGRTRPATTPVAAIRSAASWLQAPESPALNSDHTTPLVHNRTGTSMPISTAVARGLGWSPLHLLRSWVKHMTAIRAWPLARAACRPSACRRLSSHSASRSSGRRRELPGAAG